MIRRFLSSTALLGGLSLALISPASASVKKPPVAPDPAITKEVVVEKEATAAAKDSPCKIEPCKKAEETTCKKVDESVAPQLKFAGQTSFDNWMFKNSVRTIPGDSANNAWNRKGNGRGQYFSVDDSRFHISVDGKTDLGMEYGLHFTLNGDTGSTNTLRENYLFFGGSWGKLFLGDTYGVESTMTFGGWDNWGGTLFIDGGMVEHTVNVTTGTVVSDNLVGDTGRSTKMTYLTPRWEGFQFGVSYTPRGDHLGQGSVNSLVSASSPKVPFDTDTVASTLNFMHQFENSIEIALSANSIFARTHPEYTQGATTPVPYNRQNVGSFALGGRISYQGLGFSTEYGNNGKSRQIAGQSLSNAGQFVSYGLSYTHGATKVSTGYWYSWRNALGGGINPSTYTKVKATTSAAGAAIDHKLAPGLVVYFEYANFRMKNPAALNEANRLNASTNSSSNSFVAPIPSNTANSFVVGSRLVF